MKVAGLIIGVLLLSGCAGQNGVPWLAQSTPGACARPDSSQELGLNMADELLADGRPHASLAHLEEMPDSLIQVRVRKAKVLRLLGSSEAEPLYRGLLGTCMGAEAEHGLGQLAADRGDKVLARQHLMRAARLAPTDEKIRNDLGVVYLEQGELEKARFEFLTAIELKDDRLAAVNLVTLLLYQDKWQQAADLVSRLGLSAAQFSEAQARAEQLKPGGAQPPRSPS